MCINSAKLAEKPSLQGQNSKQSRSVEVVNIPYQATTCNGYTTSRTGQIASLMKLSLQIAAHGVKVAFVTTEFTHEKLVASSRAKIQEKQSLISLIPIPDGLEPEDDGRDFVKLRDSIFRVMPSHLSSLIENINGFDVNEQITCVIADTAASWALEVAKKMGIKNAAVLLPGPANMALALHVPKLIEAGIIDTDGTPMKDESITLSEDIPAWSSSELPWSSCDPVMQKLLFSYVSSGIRTFKSADQILCNTFYELDSSVIKLVPKLIPIGPFSAINQFEAFAGSFWPEDSTCLEWLDKQTAGSVIYVALGSTTILSPQQIDELALGLELTGLPFVWVVRANMTKGTSKAKFPEGFLERVVDRGKFVQWAPQKMVLAHPAIACFVSHCGWNSALEGLSMGTPFLCWPYFADQFHNRSYICDIWKIGLALDKDENGIITSNEISKKINMLLSSDGIKANALHLKEAARKTVCEGGSSFKSSNSFIQEI